MKNQFIDRQRRPFNEIIINNASELPTPTDTGDGLGTAYRFASDKFYKFGASVGISVAYPFVISGARIDGPAEITYTGTGALFRNNSTTPAIITLRDTTFVGNGTNQAFSVTSGLFLDIHDCLFRNFDMGTISNTNGVFFTSTGIRFQADKLVLDNIANRISFTDFALVTPTPIGDSLIEIIGSPAVTVETAFLQPSGSDSAFDIDSGFTGSFDFSHSKALGNGIAFNPGGLDQTSIYVNTIAVSGISDSQTIGSFYMERNATVTNPTIQGQTGSITAFADAGGGQVTVTSAGHGLSNGDIVWLLDDTYTGKYTISNVLTNTFEITTTFTSTSTGTWETGWTKVAGTTFPMENERASMTDNNKVTFINLESKRITIHVSTNPANDTIAAAKDWEFAVMKNDVRVKGSLKFREMNNKAGEGVITATETVVSGDYFEVYTRNISDTTTNMIMENMSMVIE